MAASLNRGVLFAVLAIFVLLTSAIVPSKRDSRPNVVVILVDDQDKHMHSMDLMDNLQSMMIQEGVFFNKHYGHVSTCCPARTTIWTGLHAHNTNVTNIDNDMAGSGYKQVVAKGWNKNNLGVWMQKAGYSTYFSGKLFNGYGEDNYCTPECMEGFDKADWFVGGSTYAYYGTDFVQFDGSNSNLWKGNNSAYSTDQVADNVANFIDASAKAGNPFFAVAAPVAPHGPAKPKIEYENLYPNLEIPKSPNWNPANRTGVGPIWALEQMSEAQIAETENGYRRRQRTLKSVDDLIETIIQKLDETGTLDNTYIIYTSDNGYHLGNHRLTGGKWLCYEEDINLPMIIRGPNVGKNKQTDLVTGHVDIVPTVLAIGGYGDNVTSDDIGITLDGTPITFPLEDDSDFERNFNSRGETTHLEFWGPFGMEWDLGPRPVGPDFLAIYKALRVQSPDYSLMYSVWCHEAQHELYDMSWDPYQMSNLHPSAPVEGNATNPFNSGNNQLLGRPTDEVIHRLDALVLVLKDCSGYDCRWPWRALHPDGSVQTLTDALAEKHDSFYANNYKMAKVGWEQCYHGYVSNSGKHIGGPDSTLYALANEQPSFKNVNAGIRLTSGINWTAWILAWVAYFCYKSAMS